MPVPALVKANRLVAGLRLAFDRVALCGRRVALSKPLSLCAGPRVRIRLPPAVSPVRTGLPRTIRQHR
jgi:hypothetical protein